jgi:predicted transcriptional regulator
MKIPTFYANLTVFMIILISFSCIYSKPNRNQEYTKLDSIWLPFARALESKNTAFLLEHSLDSISCIDCGIDSNNQQEYFNSRFIFECQIEKLIHIKSLLNEPFSSYQIDSNQIVIKYTVKTYHAPEGSYGLFFMIRKIEKKYYFQGMMLQ